MSWDDGSTSNKKGRKRAPKGDASKLRKATRHCRRKETLPVGVTLFLTSATLPLRLLAHVLLQEDGHCVKWRIGEVPLGERRSLSGSRAVGFALAGGVGSGGLLLMWGRRLLGQRGSG
ncbi:hypothetical protein V8C34DRAFT_251002 [Trichoderma compactum]